MGNFESEMRDMFDGVEFQPSERVWAGVEKALNEKKNKGIFFMWQTYGIAAAIALFITAGTLYKNGFFTNQPDPIQGTKQLTESEEQISTDTLKMDEGNQQLLAKEGQMEGKGSNADVQEPIDARVNLMAANAVREAIDGISIVNNEPSQTSLIVTSEDVSVDELIVDLDNPYELQRAQIKPYQPSLAATKAKWLNRLGVDESALAAMVKVAESKPEFVGENFFNGRVGSNNFNISNGANNGQALVARAEDANFQALANIENRPEETLGSLSAGLGFSFELSERLQLNTGLRYSELRVRTTSNAYSVENGQSFPIYLPLGYDPDNVNFVGNYDLVNTLQGVSVQPTLSYKLAKFGKFDVSVIGGAGLDYFFSYRLKGNLNFLSVRKANLNESDFIKKFNLSAVSGVGVNYRLNNQFGISADLNYRYFLPSGKTENRRNSSVIGFGLGVNYFIHKREEE